MQFKKTLSMSSRTGRVLQRYNEGCRQVVGCIPYRYRKTNQSCSNHGSRIDALEFLLVSSQKNPRMMFPKGGWEIDETLKEAALRETFEEAGVLGEVEIQDYLGTWSFKSKSQGTFHEGHMMPLRVTEEADDWPEKAVRHRLWMTFSEAREVCCHPWMKEALDVFASKLAKRKEEEPQTCPFKELPDDGKTNIGMVAKQMYNEEPRISAEANSLLCEEQTFSDELQVDTAADSTLSEEEPRMCTNSNTMFNEERGISRVSKPMFGEDTRISIASLS